MAEPRTFDAYTTFKSFFTGQLLPVDLKYIRPKLSEYEGYNYATLKADIRSFFSLLEQQGCISPNNPDELLILLKEIGRPDLVIHPTVQQYYATLSEERQVFLTKLCSTIPTLVYPFFSSFHCISAHLVSVCFFSSMDLVPI